MATNHSNIAWTVSQFKKMADNKKFDFNHLVQRGEVWKNDTQSRFIETLCLGYFVPPILSKKAMAEVDGKTVPVYTVLDGKQRLTTVISFLNDEWKLGELLPITLESGETEDISGKAFSELSETMQNAIQSATLSMVYFDEGMTFEEERQQFLRTNSGIALTTKNKLLASCNNLEKIYAFHEHDLFKRIFSAKKRESKMEVSFIEKIAMMMFYGFKADFSATAFTNFVGKYVMTEEQSAEIGATLDYAENVLDNLFTENETVYKALCKETHLVSFMPYMARANEEEIAEEDFANAVISFFEDKKDYYDDYANACVSGSAKATSIRTRNASIGYWYDDMFHTAEEETETEEETEE